MRIEEEIKQKNFSSDFEKLAVNILFSCSWLNKYQKRIFGEFQITATQYNILRILRGQNKNPVSVNLLRERMIDKMCDASRLVERLRAKGLVERKASENDRRKTDVSISKKGLELLNKLDDINKKFEKLFESLDILEVKELNNLLDKMRG